MIIKKQIYFDGKPYILSYSDKKVLIRETTTGNLFSSAMDDINFPREYKETESIIDSEDLQGYYDELEKI